MRPRFWHADWNWLPLVVAVCGWCATLMLCRVMISRERAQVIQTATLAARGIRSKLSASISTHVAPLEALVARWGADADPWQPEWESEAKQLQQRYPALESINWVDSSYNERWGIPSPLVHPESVRSAMDATRASGKTTIAPAGGTGDGSRALLVLIPVFRNANYKGCVIATLGT